MNKIAIHSVPRSGSSWLGEIINSAPNVNYAFQPLFSYDFKSRLNDTSAKEDIDAFFNDISLSDDSFIRQKDDRLNNRKPIFMKNNIFDTIAYKEVRYHSILENMLNETSDVKVIGLVRDPRAVMSSWYKAKREFRTDLGWKLDEELMFAEKKNENRKEEYFGLAKWVETTLLFEQLAKKYPANFKLVMYNDLIFDTENIVRDIFSFLDLEFSQSTLSFLSLDKEIDATYSVFKSKNKDNLWLENLDIEVIKKIESYVIKHHLSKYLVSQDF